MSTPSDDRLAELVTSYKIGTEASKNRSTLFSFIGVEVKCNGMQIAVS